MDINKILKADYIDILYDGKNKQYGGYELRKKYKNRATTAFLICLGVIALLFAFKFINFAGKSESIVDVPPPNIEDVVLEPPPPPEEAAPPPPEVNVPPPPIKPTVKFTPPVIAKNEEVVETDVIQETPTEEVPGPETQEGSDDIKAIEPDLNMTSGDGVVSGDDQTIYTSVSRLAEPTVNMKEFLEKNIKYPAEAKLNEISGRVALQFVVEIDGTITDIQVVGNKRLGYGLEEEAIRVMKKVPKWRPAEQNGKQVRSRFVQHVFFKIN